MFSYFFNTSPLSTLSSLHSVLANYTCKANRKLNTPTSRDYRESGTLAECCDKVVMALDPAPLQPARPFPIPR